MFTLKVVWRVKFYKFLISTVSLLLIVCLLSSCSVFNKDDNSGTFFMLKDLPEYNIIENGVAYYDSNSTYTDKLVASKDYGEIMPFLGGYYKYDYVPDNKDKGKDKDKIYQHKSIYDSIYPLANGAHYRILDIAPPAPRNVLSKVNIKKERICQQGPCTTYPYCQQHKDECKNAKAHPARCAYSLKASH
jgi:hypothetical protein